MVMPVNMNNNEEVTPKSVDPAREKCTEEWKQNIDKVEEIKTEESKKWNESNKKKAFGDISF